MQILDGRLVDLPLKVQLFWMYLKPTVFLTGQRPSKMMSLVGCSVCLEDTRSLKSMIDLVVMVGTSFF